MTSKLYSFHQYLPFPHGESVWGVQTTDLGCTRIPPGSPYPPGRHPESYALNQEQGRVLNEYQVIYITRGGGRFWSEASGKTEVREGSILFLFPGVRHRYRPHPATGWDEHWMGYIGPAADRVMKGLFSPAHPVHRIGPQPALTGLFSDAVSLARHHTPGYPERIALRVLDILLMVHQTLHSSDRDASPYAQVIRTACSQMTGQVDQPFDAAAFAKEHGCSLSSFRRHFKDLTGVPPTEYLLELRLRKAKGLLQQTTLPVHVVASECGFENPLYFSRFYQQRTGHAPSRARQEK